MPNQSATLIVCSFPLSVSIETTSVSLVVDIEADTHPNLPSIRHTDEPIRAKQLSVALPSFVRMTEGEAITGCQSIGLTLLV